MAMNKNKNVDILIIAEGTYPFVRGGVSSWIHQLISGLKEFKFGVIFLGSQKSEYEDIKYELPDNLVYLNIQYLFGEKYDMPDAVTLKKSKSFEKIIKLHKSLEANKNIPKEAKKIEFYNKEASFEVFMRSMSSWDFIQEKYLENTNDSSFIDYFWSVRNMHTPIWRVIQAIDDIGEFKIVHSPSTGYAGFLAVLLAQNFDKPFVLTEHGIYIKERKIDLLNAQWLNSKKSIFQKKLGEIPYSKSMWIKFFEGIGKFAYQSADKIISLYEGARKTQLEYGANQAKTEVIPNGVDIKKLSSLQKENIPSVITLIGRVVPIKDIKTFIKAIKIVTEKMPEVEGWIVGPEDEDKEYAQECRMLVKNLGIEKNIKFLGFQNIMDILPKSGILTLSSISEGMPLVVIEGFAAGIPCVSTDVGCCKELIYGKNDEDKGLGKAGEITRIGDAPALAKGYKELLLNKDYYKQCKEVAIKRVNKFYTKQIFLDSYRKIYKDYLWQE